MKTKRFFSLFLLMVLVLSLWTAPHAAALDDPEVQAKAALLVDAKTGNIVYAKNEHQEMYPASTTKIMTALLVMEAIDQGKLSLTDQLTASHTAMTTGLAEDGSTANIQNSTSPACWWSPPMRPAMCWLKQSAAAWRPLWMP